MAKLADILQQERDRETAEQWGIIHLYKTGSFYSAYEWSAWLIAVITFNDEVRMQTKDRKPIAVTRIPMAKSDETFCRVGFPLKSIEKYIPTRLNWQEPAYAMSLDIRGYFMHINREILLKIATDSLRKMSTHRVGLSDDIATIPSGVLLTPATRWCDIRDFDFILWLTEQIVMLNPMDNCHIVGDLHDWDDIDHAKCMRFAEPGVALPIGNLTSQLFSNVYLNVFDQFIKRDILCRHYGRYVDDSVQIDPDREWLIQQVPREREFLADELGLQLHMGKLHIQEIHSGVEFLGAFVKPYRDYVSNKTLERMTKKIQEIDLRNEDKAVRTIDSYLGILSHTASRHIATDLGLASKPLAA